MRRLVFGAALVVPAAVVALATQAAEPPSASSPSASASSAPPASASSAAPAPLPTVTGAEIPNGESPAPSGAEWSHGKRVAPTRGRPGPCELTLVREWLRVRCPGLVGGGLVAGEPRGVSVQVVGRLFNDDGTPGNVTTLVVLPLRRGEARVVSFNDTAFEYDSTALAPGGVLSVQWRAARPDPVLVMSDIPAHPPTTGFLGPE